MQHCNSAGALQQRALHLLARHVRLQGRCTFHSEQPLACSRRSGWQIGGACQGWQLPQPQPRPQQHLHTAAATAATTAVTAAAAGPVGLLDMAIVSAASAASFKLLVLCAVVAWMSHRGMIPPNSSQVMSQIAFSLTIPAMLLASTTKTLSNCHVSNLAAIPVFALLQIALGAVLGRVAAAAVEGRLPLTRALLGWGSLSPTPSAAAIAASTAAALRAPAAAPALLPKSDKGIPDGLPQLIQLACSFGNTVTLPLMYLMTMLSAADASRATGYMSLFHAAWSPCLWLFGYSSIQAAGQKKGSSSSRRRKRNSGFSGAWRLYWSRVAAALGLKTASSAGSSSSSSAGRSSGSSSSSSSFAVPIAQPVLITKQLPPSAAAGRPGQGGRAVYAVTSEGEQADESPAEALVRRILALGKALVGVELLQQAAKAINPPVAAAIGGLVLGITPAGRLLSDSSAAAAFVSTHATTPFTSWELTLLLGMLQCCWQTVELLASGTLALQALVLAASLFGARPGSSSSSTAAASSSAAGGSDAGGGSSGAGTAPSWRAVGQQGTVEVESPGGVRVDMDGGGYSSEDESSADMTDNGGGGSSSGGSSFSVLPGSSSIGRGSSSSGSSTGGSDLGAKVVTGINVVHRSAGTPDDASVSVLSQLKPQAAWEWRAMLAVAAVRFVLLPAATCGLVLLGLHLGLLPPDPVCAFMLLLQAAMPPAQNLVLMVQLQPSTATLAPATARLLLQLYTLAVLPVTVWVSVFAKLVM